MCKESDKADVLIVSSQLHERWQILHASRWSESEGCQGVETYASDAEFVRCCHLDDEFHGGEAAGWFNAEDEQEEKMSD